MRVASLVEAVPGGTLLIRKFRERRALRQLRRKSAEAVFTEIFASNEWGSAESVSGQGSTLHQTRVVIQQLPVLFRQLGVRSMLDVPCGDFNWMRAVDFEGVSYTGGDIVASIVERNKAAHEREGVRFDKLDLIQDRLPKVDLVFCRDCLVHLSYADLTRALLNICRSDSTYLLTTTFPGRTNRDIATGQWRPIDLQKAPCALPEPMLVINEQCTEADGVFADKSMALWRVADVRRALQAAPRRRPLVTMLADKARAFYLGLGPLWVTHLAEELQTAL